MSTIQKSYRKPVSLKVTADATDASNGYVEVEVSTIHDVSGEVIVDFNAYDSGGVEKGSEAKLTYTPSGGLLKIEDNSGFSVADGDVYDLQITYI